MRVSRIDEFLNYGVPVIAVPDMEAFLSNKM
jgi:hypothetical protein